MVGDDPAQHSGPVDVEIMVALALCAVSPNIVANQGGTLQGSCQNVLTAEAQADPI